MNLIFISAVSGVGKSTACEYIKNNNLLEDYSIFDIDDLENINEYNSEAYNLFYENSIKNAIKKSNNKNIIIGSCINPLDIKKINIPKEIEKVEMILITCSNEELEKRLKRRDESRNCGSEKYIKDQINYQNYMLNHLDMYKLHVDNTDISVQTTANRIVQYIKKDNIISRAKNK